LPKVFSSYPLSPRWGERARVRGGKKNLFAKSIIVRLGNLKEIAPSKRRIFRRGGSSFPTRQGS
jgi:hypothetical protein